MKRALVTGSDGFVGRHIVKRLREDRFEVTGIDIKSGRECRAYFRDFIDRFDLVVHCAAIVGGRAKIDGDPLGVAENLAIDSDMFRWAVRTKQPRVVYFSSSAAYPVAYQTKSESHPTPEGIRLFDTYRLGEFDIDLDDPSLPDQTYGWAKITGERLAVLARQNGVDVTVYRPFSGYGEDQDLNYPFPSFIRRAQDTRPFFKIWGDATSQRDWIHIDDVVNAVFAGLEANVSSEHHAVNLCTGYGTTFQRLAYQVCEALGFEPVIEEDLQAPMGVHTRVGNPGLMNQFYTPSITLKEGIRRALCV